MPEQTHQKEKRDAALEARITECMAEMINKGFVEYSDRKTGKTQKLTFETVISEGVETEGFIPAMFQFYKNPHDTISKAVLLAAIDSLVTDYIEGDVIASEMGE